MRARGADTPGMPIARRRKFQRRSLSLSLVAGGAGRPRGSTRPPRAARRHVYLYTPCAAPLQPSYSAVALTRTRSGNVDRKLQFSALACICVCAREMYIGRPRAALTCSARMPPPPTHLCLYTRLARLRRKEREREKDFAATAIGFRGS